ncbi:hypothetical protein, partial [Ralstonia pseudosolanacearum]|uniref:hypothetical protein n=1 Tax=Ralstonia pseudosolanacearum TaxID=1310165 RepID=UPI003CEF8EBD
MVFEPVESLIGLYDIGLGNDEISAIYIEECIRILTVYDFERFCMLHNLLWFRSGRELEPVSRMNEHTLISLIYK